MANRNQTSQQKFLRRLIKKNVMAPEIDEAIKTHEELVRSCYMVIKENTEVMKQIMKNFGEE